MTTHRPPEPLTPDEVQRLIRAASPRSSSGIRMRALIAVLFGAGLRIQEALSLLPRDVNTTQCTVHVRNPKGGPRRTRRVKIDPQACTHIDLWLLQRRTLGLTGNQPIFATYSKNSKKFGRAMYATQVRAALRRLAERAGIEKAVRPHGLRHSHAFQLAENGVPMHHIKHQLGHSNLAVTSRYIDHLHPGSVEIDVMKKE